MMEMERRERLMEVRTTEEAGKKTIGGNAVEYNKPTTIRDRWGDEFQEEIAAGAFDESLRSLPVKALWNHDSGKPLGSTKASTLRFNPNTTALSYDVDVPNNSWGADAYESVKRGDVDGSSFGMIVLDDRWSTVQVGGRSIDKRTILKAELHEVSPCTFPAYSSSQISCRSREQMREEREAVELERERQLLLAE